MRQVQDVPDSPLGVAQCGSRFYARAMWAEVIGMASGGARGRSGPAPDPKALRRDRKDDASWVTLPAGGFDGPVPEFPLPKAIHYERFFENGKKVEVRDDDATEVAWDAELELWETLWRKPQAAMWSKLGMSLDVAAYVRAFLESVEAEASAGLKTAVLRMAGEIGLSLPGMHSLRWKFSEDELGARREGSRPVAVKSGPSSKDRWAALANEG